MYFVYFVVVLGGFAVNWVMNALELANQLVVRFGEVLSPPAEFRGEVTLICRDAERIQEVSEFAKKQLGCDYKAERDAAILGAIKSLQIINDAPRDQLWKKGGVKNEQF